MSTAHLTRRQTTFTQPGLDTTINNIAHLFRRAGFGAPPADVYAAAQKGTSATISALVDYGQTPDNFTPPPDAALTVGKQRKADALAMWWLTRMITTPRQLQEKMVLFWHGHFATGITKVRSPLFMYLQNQTFRDKGMGSFDDLLTAVYKDPAMLIWLDGTRNVAGSPNENFGREVMELFTLGRGNYTEDDVHNMARAFTGWRVDPNTGDVTFVPKLHDNSIKTILGQSGNWGSDDAVRILAAHPATGPFLDTKLWKFFASDQTIPSSAINKISVTYYSSGHSIREMVRTMFSLPEFFTPNVQQGHIKSPTEFVVTVVRQLNISQINLASVPRYLATLGQELFDPPNVGGWPGGPNWIGSGTMLARFNLASQLTGDAPGVATATIDTDAILKASGADNVTQLLSYITGALGMTTGPDTLQALLRYTGNGPIDSIDAATKIKGIIHLSMVSPEYQVA